MFFSEKEKKVFKFHNGMADQWCDPLRVRRRLLQGTNGQLSQTWSKAGEVGDAIRAKTVVSQESLAAEETLLAAARRAFDLPAFDPATGDGARDVDVWGVLNAYAAWLSFVAGGGGSGPTPSPSSLDSPSAGPSPSGGGFAST